MRYFFAGLSRWSTPGMIIQMPVHQGPRPVIFFSLKNLLKHVADHGVTISISSSGEFVEDVAIGWIVISREISPSAGEETVSFHCLPSQEDREVFVVSDVLYFGNDYHAGFLEEPLVLPSRIDDLMRDNSHATRLCSLCQIVCMAVRPISWFTRESPGEFFF